ncbi:MAG: UDP-N-acetylglucosamine 1-carboxyvinyltransferase [Eubacteriales bacterium]|nr:UDP-N-acetylglucosamine 1-carboxyvinyltransferase [Eubacteriales bacterium]
MERYVIKGGKPLVGEVVIGGAKNAALGILAAAVMTDGQCHIDNMPDVRDINVLLQAMKEIGAIVDRKGPNEVVISGKDMNPDNLVVDNEFIRKIRAGYYLIGALLGKYKKAKVVLPGGCDIGARPIDQHIKGFRALGAKVVIEQGMIYVEAEELRGTHMYLDVVSVGATINIMMAASMAVGNTTIENAAKEPHVVDVANFLNSMGANIKGAGTDVIRIKGVERFHDTEYSIIPDQIEAGTFMMAAAATRGDIIVKNIIPKHMEAISAKLIEIGAEVTESDDAIRVRVDHRLKHTQIKTLPYPGFPTDMQPQMAITLGLSTGTSMIVESIFENRFRYVDELRLMGANFRVMEGDTAIITGVEKYTGARIEAPDLRAGAALVIAGLAADGWTTITEIGYIHRGYEHFEEKLRGLGGVIKMVHSDEEENLFKFNNN